MNRITSIFRGLREQHRTGLMPFITAGYPTLDVTLQTIPVLQHAGASIVEIGFPFSDPIADGPVIAASMHEALVAGISPTQIFEGIARVRGETTVGLLAMVSYSILRRMGEERFLREAASAGFDGLIVPDVDLDRAAAVRDRADACGLTFTVLVAPTSTPSRIERLVAVCSGFVYVLARVGITGESADLPDIAARTAAIREHTDLPLAVGFGISTAEHVSAVTAHADAAIVGSAVVRRMGSSDDPVAAARDTVASLADGLTVGAR